MARTRKTKTSKEIIDRLTEGGVSPVEVMVITMRRLYKDYDELMGEAEMCRNDDQKMSYLKQAGACMVEACEIAKNVAPYFHPRLQSVVVGGDDGAPPVQVELTGVDALRKLIRGKTAVVTQIAAVPKPENK
jgi:hypothetical protein